MMNVDGDNFVQPSFESNHGYRMPSESVLGKRTPLLKGSLFFSSQSKGDFCNQVGAIEYNGKFTKQHL
jgi:hypothetical protein